MKLDFADLIAISNALADKMDYMVQNADGTDRNANIVYAHLKDLFKKVNDEYSDRVTAIYDIHTPLEGE